jgi:hypothetical protein
MVPVAEMLARQEPPARAEAEQHYRGALAMARTLGMRPLQQRCEEGLRGLMA